MCPGIAVLGGGGGGGDGDGDGAGGKDGSGGDGKGKGDGAGGDGKSAAGCGGGGGSDCTIHHPSAARGDPVDVTSGRVFTDPALDVGFRGPLPLAITRSYSTAAAERDVGLGFGWNHSLGWEIEVTRREVIVWKPGGTRAVFAPLKVGEHAIGRDGYLLERRPDGYVLDIDDDLLRHLAPSDAQGKRYQLSEISDRNGNRIAIKYAGEHILEITDSVGRVVRAKKTPDGHIAAFEAQSNLPGTTDGAWITLVTYTHDDAGDLVAVTDGDGHTTRFAYDDHRMVLQALPTGLTYHYVYDREQRCVETWGDYPGGADPSLAADIPARLAGGNTRAKGILHYRFEFGDNGYSEAVSSVAAERFFGNQFGKLDKAVAGGGVTTNVFDEHGFVLARTNPVDATTVWERDERGRVVKEIDPLGRATTLERDLAGHIIRATDPNGAVTVFAYDSRGNPESIVDAVGGVRSYRYDARGLLTDYGQENGGVVRFEHDAHGNWTSATFPNGAIWHATYDAWGRRITFTTPMGGTFRYRYNAAGDVVLRQDANQGATTYEYDGLGQLTRTVDPDGRAHDFIWGGHRKLCEIKKPDGTSIRYRYNREGWLVEIWNEQGEVYRYKHDTDGAVVAETRFDGSTLSYKYDLVGQLLRFVDPGKRVTEFEYSLTGDLLTRTYDDGSDEKYAYDSIGNVVSGTNAAGTVTFERDLLGRVIREVQDFGGEAHSVDTRLDSMGDRVFRGTSLGHTEEVHRNVLGFRERVVLDGTEVLTERRDLLGGRLEQWLPGGGLIQQVFDLQGNILRQRVTTDKQREAPAAIGPAWVGAPPRSANLDQTFRYSLAGELLDTWDQDRGATRYEYDPVGRLLAAIPERARAESFRYDAAGNVFETGEGTPAREYDKANRLLRRGATTYRWDDCGQLVEKRQAATPSSPERTWTYRWSERGLLAEVTTPDNTAIELVYDAFARRIFKRSRSAVSLGAPTNVLVTRFVWDGQTLVHERRFTDGEVQLDRTYCFAMDSFIPYAHGERRGQEPCAWFYYVNDPVGAPDSLVDAQGEVACRLRQGVWGRLAPEDGARTSTPFRFQGQYEDEETGLSYNRFRYYDPELGRFISVDPYAPDASLNGFDYGVNPFSWIDPLGLVGRGTHYADVSITGRDGNVRANTQMDSHMTDEQLATYNRSRAQTGGRGGAAASEMRRACHTERKTCDSPDGWAYQQGIKRGETVSIAGRLEPCKKCRDSMQALSDKKKCTVTYTPGMSGNPGTSWQVVNGRVTREN